MVLVVKNPPAGAGDLRQQFHPWVGKIPWRRAWQPTPVFLPGESHSQRIGAHILILLRFLHPRSWRIIRKLKGKSKKMADNAFLRN